MRLGRGYSNRRVSFFCDLTLWSGVGGSGTYLEMIDVDVEASLSAFGKRIREFRVGFAQDAILGVLK